jgi:superfamily II DNA or RNA helicase/HKD family nuclease
MREGDYRPGLYEDLVTATIEESLASLDDALVVPQLQALANSEASDRLSRHLAMVVARAIDAIPEEHRAQLGARLVQQLLESLLQSDDSLVEDDDLPLTPTRVLTAILPRNLDGSVQRLESPLTPLLDTTLLTNSPGEPAVGHELRAEIRSSDSIDLVMAFIRWSGIRPLMGALHQHCSTGKPLRVVTTTYTNSTEVRALDELQRLGAQIKVSYDTSSTRLHAKAWLFTRGSGLSTAYIGSSNLSHSAMVTGLEWNVRVSSVRNPDVISKVGAVFDTYWASGDFESFVHDDFAARTLVEERDGAPLLAPVEIFLHPFQERLLEQVELSRSVGRHRNLLVSATGTGKTVMAAVDFARLRRKLARDRLLFVAHRKEILEQSLSTFRYALRDASFGELWVGGMRPSRFDHVFASVQSLSKAALDSVESAYFDVVIVDEFHHAAAPSYQALLEHFTPVELLGMTATPERADGLDILRYFDGGIAAELRVWDAIDQQYLVPFSYFGIHDGSDLSSVAWKRGAGYDPSELTAVLTADHALARRIIDQTRRVVGSLHEMRALGFCVTVAHARFMAERFRAAGVPAVAVWADGPREERAAALHDLDRGSVNIVFTVDLFNEGVDVPNVDTLLLLRPTESPTLYLQQLGRGLRRAPDKSLCTVLDFVGNHRREFRFDRKLRALLGGSRRDVQRQVEGDFPFLPSGCHMELDPVARDVVLRSLRQALPSDWRSKCEELRALGDVSLMEYLDETGLELEDVYANGRSWSALRRASGLDSDAPGPHEDGLLRSLGRLLHVDDRERIGAYRSLVATESPPSLDSLAEIDRRYARMLVGSVTTLRTASSLEEGCGELWQHPQVRGELIELLDILPGRVSHLHTPISINDVPLAIHARYTRSEILAAFNVGGGVKPPTWQTGVWWVGSLSSDLFAFTLDKSAGSFSPNTRYRDYAISPDLIHWESQSSTSVDSDVGRRYIHQAERGTNVVLFARLRTDDRAFWCLGPATYVEHKGDRPIAIKWKLRERLPGDLFAEFAAAVA